MASYDFSGLNQLAQGFRIVSETTPFDTSPTDPATISERSAQGGKRPRFADSSGARDYNFFYRIAHGFHQAHTPPTGDPEYMERLQLDMATAASDNGNDPFLMDLLMAVYNELEREHGVLRTSHQEA